MFFLLSVSHPYSSVSTSRRKFVPSSLRNSSLVSPAKSIWRGNRATFILCYLTPTTPSARRNWTPSLSCKLSFASLWMPGRRQNCTPLFSCNPLVILPFESVWTCNCATLSLSVLFHNEFSAFVPWRNFAQSSFFLLISFAVSVWSRITMRPMSRTI